MKSLIYVLAFFFSLSLVASYSHVANASCSGHNSKGPRYANTNPDNPDKSNRAKKPTQLASEKHRSRG